MEHVIIPLDGDHARAVVALAGQIAEACGRAEVRAPPCPHITLVAFEGTELAVAHAAVSEAVAGLAPFEIRAHGYGVFARTGRSAPSLNVPVVRGAALDGIHRRIHEGLLAAGAQVAGWTAPDTWSPHITLTDEGLDARSVGQAISVLADHHHPSWHVPIRRVLVVGGWAEPTQSAPIPLSSTR